MAKMLSDVSLLSSFDRLRFLPKASSSPNNHETKSSRLRGLFWAKLSSIFVPRGTDAPFHAFSTHRFLVRVR